MKLSATSRRLTDLCQHHGLPVPWLPDDATLGLGPDDGVDPAYGRVWCGRLADSYQDDIEEALETLGAAAGTHQLAAFGVELPRSGRGRPRLDYLLSSPAVHVELSLPVRARPQDLRLLGDWIQRCSAVAKSAWGSASPRGLRTAYVIRPDQFAYGPLGSGLPTLRWLDTHDVNPADLALAMTDQEKQ